MAQASARFLEEIRRSHTIYSYVDVISPQQETVRLPATDGDVSCDGTANVRRSCRIQCVDHEGTLVPSGPASILTPYGTEIRPYRGVRYQDGTTEVYPLGVFRLSKSDVKESPVGSPEISIEGSDLSRTVARDKFVEPYAIDEGTNVVTAIKNILARTFAGLEYDAISSSLATTAPLLYDADSDPWEAATKLAESIGAVLYFDVVGRVVIAPPTDIDSLPSPDFTYIEGQNCSMLDLSQVFSDEPGFNGVIVTGESPGDELPPVRGESWDEEPSSPTYRFGPYGEVPMFHSDSLVKTDAEAATVAKSLLAGQLGFSSQLSITALVNPSYEAGDVVEVVRAKSHVSGLYAIDSFNVPLGDGTQSIALRQKRTV